MPDDGHAVLELVALDGMEIHTWSCTSCTWRRSHASHTPPRCADDRLGRGGPSSATPARSVCSSRLAGQVFDITNDIEYAPAAARTLMTWTQDFELDPAAGVEESAAVQRMGTHGRENQKQSKRTVETKGS